MSYHLMQETFPIARKNHRCIWCGERIPIGEKYRYEVSVYDGRFQNHKWHLECNEAADEACRDGDEEFGPYENDRPKKDEIQTSPPAGSF